MARQLDRKLLHRAGLTPGEVELLATEGVCRTCDHLEALHNYHCCTFCTVPECDCDGHGEFHPETPEDLAARKATEAEKVAREIAKRAERVVTLADKNRARADVGLPPIDANGNHLSPAITEDGPQITGV